MALRAAQVILVATQLKYFLQEGGEGRKIFYLICSSSETRSITSTSNGLQQQLHVPIFNRMWSQRQLEVCIWWPEGNILILAESYCRKLREVEVHLTKEKENWQTVLLLPKENLTHWSGRRKLDPLCLRVTELLMGKPFIDHPRLGYWGVFVLSFLLWNIHAA